jgi:serine/threonine protein kinase
VLLDDEGNIKLADFGLSRISTSPLALQHTICGSMQYMAPGKKFTKLKYYNFLLNSFKIYL